LPRGGWGSLVAAGFDNVEPDTVAVDLASLRSVDQVPFFRAHTSISPFSSPLRLAVSEAAKVTPRWVPFWVQSSMYVGKSWCCARAISSWVRPSGCPAFTFSGDFRHLEPIGAGDSVPRPVERVDELDHELCPGRRGSGLAVETVAPDTLGPKYRSRDARLFLRRDARRHVESAWAAIEPRRPGPAFHGTLAQSEGGQKTFSALSEGVLDEIAFLGHRGPTLPKSYPKKDQAGRGARGCRGSHVRTAPQILRRAGERSVRLNRSIPPEASIWHKLRPLPSFAVYESRRPGVSRLCGDQPEADDRPQPR